MDDHVVTLTPDRGVVVRWTLVGAVATLLAGWAAVDAGDSVLAWAFVALCLVVTSYVVAQLVRPGRFRLILDASGLDVHLPWQRTRVPWSRVHVARVVTVAGEPVLELHLWDPEDVAQDSPRATGVLLPLGADLDALHGALARHLGHADDPDAAPSSTPVTP